MKSLTQTRKQHQTNKQTQTTEKQTNKQKKKSNRLSYFFLKASLFFHSSANCS